MRVAVVGSSGVVGRRAVAAAVEAGHDVVALTRGRAAADLVTWLGAVPVPGDVLDPSSLVRLLDRADAVVSLATAVPVGRSLARPGAWRRNDRLLTTGVGNVVAAARTCGVRRVVQASVSFVYADRGEEWVSEGHPVDITPATEPMADAEAQVHDATDARCTGVVLRLGTIVGDDPMTRAQLGACRRGRPIGLGRVDQWVPVVHTSDLGTAILASLHASSGIYNVAAEPVRRHDLLAGFARAAGVDEAGYLGAFARRLTGDRLEPLERSLRVCSDRFAAETGWSPRRPAFADDWFTEDVPAAVR